MSTLKLSRILSIPKNYLLPVSILLYYTICLVYYLLFYFPGGTEIYIGLLMAPYIVVLKKGEYSYRYGAPMLLFLLVMFFVPVKTALLLSLVFASIFLIETCIGKINSAPLLLFILLLPVFTYFKNSIGFPIRLWLSKLTGNVFAFLGHKVEVSGNIISLDNTEFSVDPACAGLQMLTVSLLISLFIIAYHERKTKKSASLLVCSTLLLITIVLNIICNLFRIIFLIMFKIMPGNVFHDIIGILCLTIYVIIPFLIFSKYIFNYLPNKKIKSPVASQISFFKHVLNIAVFASILFSSFRMKSNVETFSNENKLSIEGFSKEVLSTGIVKFENKDALIYLKPLNFYSVEHSPMICWTGSGYEFKQVNKETIADKEIYTGIMEKGKDKIYSAWWFDGGNCKTINQFEWRWDAVQSESDFCLFNINTTSRESLIGQVKIFLTKSLTQTKNSK